MSARRRQRLRVAPLALALCACGGDSLDLDVPMTLSFALPIECAAPPADLEAVLWVSGTREPTPLDVDLAANTTSGTVSVTTGVERRLVIDWFVEREGTRVMLAQAVKTLDLESPAAATVVLDISPSDVNVATCQDVRDDLSRVGSPTTTFRGEQRPPCDLNASCGPTPDASCANLGELCAGADFLR